MIIFNSKEVQKTIPIYRITHEYNALLIEHNGKTVSISNNKEFEESRELITETISAFLRTNPSGFAQVMHSLLEGCQAPNFLHTFNKDILTKIERIANSFTYRTFFFNAYGGYPYDEPFDSFRRALDFFPLNVSAFDGPTASYYPPLTMHWEIEMTPEYLIKVNYCRDDGYIRVFSCTPDVKNNEFILDPRTFTQAMRNFVELDQVGFVKTFHNIKAQYDKMHPSCNMHYYQLCLMADVYDHFEQDIHQAAYFCPWIDYD